MYKCNKCGAFFERPGEKEIESENYARPFGNGSEPFSCGYYECCPECSDEDFDRYDDEEDIDEIKVTYRTAGIKLTSKDEIIIEQSTQLAILEKALELACRTMLVPDGYCADVECPNVTCKDCLVEHFKTKAKENK